MPKISNDNSRVKLYKVDTESTASGPVVAMQIGYAPADDTFTESIFMLRRDGKWADFTALGAAGKAELWDATLFDKPGDVLKLLSSGKLDAEVYPLEIDASALASWLSRTANFTVQQRIDNLLNLYKERMRNRKR